MVRLRNIQPRAHLFCLVSIAIVAGLLVCSIPDTAQAASSSGSARREVRVLFVGNSFTTSAKGSVPKMLRTLGKANGRSVKVEWLRHGGAHLSSYIFEMSGHKNRMKELARKLKKGRWDYVVLQEQSRVGVDDSLSEMYASVRALRAKIVKYQPKAEVLLYMTHGYNAHVKSLSGKKRTVTASRLQLYIQSAYAHVGSILHIRVAPVGVNFAKCGVRYPGIKMLGRDRYHPSKAGYFLAACTFYKTIFGITPRYLAPASIGVKESTQRNLISLLKGSASLEPTGLSMQPRKIVNLALTADSGVVGAGSLNPKVATITKGGTVIAHKPGRAVLFIRTANGARATCAVSVESDKLRKEKLLFSTAETSVKQGKGFMSKLKVSGLLGSYKLKWSSSNTEVATVSTMGRVKGIRPGDAVITVKDMLTGTRASYTVHVLTKKGKRVTQALTLKSP